MRAPQEVDEPSGIFYARVRLHTGQDAPGAASDEVSKGGALSLGRLARHAVVPSILWLEACNLGGPRLGDLRPVGSTASNGGEDTGAGGRSSAGGNGGATPARGGTTGNGGIPSSGGRASADGGTASADGGSTSSNGGASDTGGASSGGAPESPCGECPSGLCLDGGVCAACRPGPTDTCGDGQYCDPSVFECKPGCKYDAACESGRCGPTHDCEQCVRGSECAEGRVCSSGQCQWACEPAPLPAPGDASADAADDGSAPPAVACSPDSTCCDHRCVRLATDHAACGACGVACSDAEYCDPTGCKANTVATVCDTKNVTIVMDGLSVDDVLSGAIENSLMTRCPVPPTTLRVSQDISTAMNVTTGRPLNTGSDLIVELGGPYGQRVIRYLENSGKSKVYLAGQDGDFLFKGRAADGGADPIYVQINPSLLSETHDFFAMEMVTDPETGSRVFGLRGFFARGTEAAVWFFHTQVLPSLSTYTAAHYVYEWTDTDGNGMPSDGDAFDRIEAGY